MDDGGPAINLVTRDDDRRLRAARQAVARAEGALHDRG
jgi:hypothetical protein